MIRVVGELHCFKHICWRETVGSGDPFVDDVPPIIPWIQVNEGPTLFACAETSRARQH
jgi:hypothetical protein